MLTAIRTQLGMAYLYSGDDESAGKLLTGLFDENPQDPEVVRAYAYYCLKIEGVTQAHEAFKRLRGIKIKSRFDRSQYHLYYGLFLLGIGEKGKAKEEFSKAHKADKNNVYVMMKLARTYYDLSNEIWIDGDIELAKTYADDCAVIVKKILDFDPDNPVGRALQEELYVKFEIVVS